MRDDLSARSPLTTSTPLSDRRVAAGERTFRVNARTWKPRLSSAFVVAPPCFPVAPMTRTVDVLMMFEG